jgi:hypothetical protein
MFFNESCSRFKLTIRDDSLGYVAERSDTADSGGVSESLGVVAVPYLLYHGASNGSQDSERRAGRTQNVIDTGIREAWNFSV